MEIIYLLKCDEQNLFKEVKGYWRFPDSILCPVRAYEAIRKAIPAAADAPLFIMPQNRTVNYSIYQSKLREYIQKIGKDPNFIVHIHELKTWFCHVIIRS